MRSINFLEQSHNFQSPEEGLGHLILMYDDIRRKQKLERQERQEFERLEKILKHESELLALGMDMDTIKALSSLSECDLRNLEEI